MTGIYSTKLVSVEWLFKASYLGGPEHIALDIPVDWDDRPRVNTLCGKDLKFNSTYSVIRRREGLIRNICVDCAMQYEVPDETKPALVREIDDKDFPF